MNTTIIDQTQDQDQIHGQDQEDEVPASQDQQDPDGDQHQDAADHDGQQPDQPEQEDPEAEQQEHREEPELEHHPPAQVPPSQDDDPLATLLASKSIHDLSLTEIAIVKAALEQAQAESRRLMAAAYHQIAPLLLSSLWKADSATKAWAFQIIDDHFTEPERDHMIAGLEVLIKQQGAAAPPPPQRKPRKPRAKASRRSTQADGRSA